MNNKGQSLIETVLALPFVMSLFLGITALLFLSLSYFFCRYHIHEYAFCHISYKENYCHSLLLRQLKKNSFITMGNINKLRSQNKITIQAEFKLKNFHKFNAFVINQEVDLNQWR